MRALRKPIGVNGRLVESDLAAGKGRGGASDSEEEESSEVSSSDSVDWWSGTILDCAGGAVGDGTELSESDQNDVGRCDRV